MSPPVFLIGGGWSAGAAPAVYGPFLDAAGRCPAVVCVVLDEGDGQAQFERWATQLTATAPCRPLLLLVPRGAVLDPRDLPDASALLVCGGLTPAYAEALAPAAAELRAWLDAGDRPYAGFSAGASIAPSHAVVGGWRAAGVPVYPEDAAEDLDDITVVPGLGLVPFAVDVHAAQWGTLGRLVAAVTSGVVAYGLALDENTLLSWHGGVGAVSGSGGAVLVTPAEGGAHVVRLSSGTVADLGPS